MQFLRRWVTSVVLGLGLVASLSSRAEMPVPGFNNAMMLMQQLKLHTENLSLEITELNKMASYWSRGMVVNPVIRNQMMANNPYINLLVRTTLTGTPVRPPVYPEWISQRLEFMVAWRAMDVSFAARDWMITPRPEIFGALLSRYGVMVPDVYFYIELMRETYLVYPNPYFNCTDPRLPAILARMEGQLFAIRQVMDALYASIYLHRYFPAPWGRIEATFVQYRLNVYGRGAMPIAPFPFIPEGYSNEPIMPRFPMVQRPGAGPIYGYDAQYWGNGFDRFNAGYVDRNPIGPGPQNAPWMGPNAFAAPMNIQNAIPGDRMPTPDAPQGMQGIPPQGGPVQGQPGMGQPGMGVPQGGPMQGGAGPMANGPQGYGPQQQPVYPGGQGQPGFQGGQGYGPQPQGGYTQGGPQQGYGPQPQGVPQGYGPQAQGVPQQGFAPGGQQQPVGQGQPPAQGQQPGVVAQPGMNGGQQVDPNAQPQPGDQSAQQGDASQQAAQPQPGDQQQQPDAGQQNVNPQANQGVNPQGNQAVNPNGQQVYQGQGYPQQGQQGYPQQGYQGQGYPQQGQQGYPQQGQNYQQGQGNRRNNGGVLWGRFDYPKQQQGNQNQ